MVNGADPVVQVKNLAASLHLPQDGLFNHVLGILGDKGLHRQAGFRCRVHGAQVADTRQSHVQRPGDGGRAQGQHIHLLPQLLEAFLVADAEALFFVHHRQTQVLELHVLLQQPVGADDDVHAAVFKAFDDFLLFLGCPETAKDFHFDGKGTEPFAEGGVVLLCEDCGRDQDGHLHAVVHRLKSRSQGNLGLAIADIAADQAVHGTHSLHVGFDLDDGPGLVRGFNEGE